MLMKRLAALLLSALLFAFSAQAQDAPLLVDRVNSPEEYADFAFDKDAELLEIWFPQILNCDAMLLQCGGETMLVDCASAKQASRVTALLDALGVREIGAVVNTHPHYDHLQGLELIASAVRVDELRICFNEAYNQHMVTAMETAKAHDIPVTHYQDGDRFTLGGAVIDVWLKGDAAWTLNEQSAQLRVQFGERTALLTADMMLKTQQRLLETVPAELLDIDILKYPHHGLNKMNDAFFAAISPVFAVITNNGTKGSPGRQYMALKHIPCAVTVPGFVHLVTDGTTWLCERVE